jgi:lipoprotein
MKKNFKFIMVGVIVLSALSITACKGNKVESKAESKTESPVANTVESTAESASTEDMNGTYDGSVYTNKAFNIKFDAKAVNMEMVSAEDLSDMQKKTHDDTLKMYAHDTANSSSVLFGLVNITSDLKAYIDGNIARINKDNEGAGDIKAESTTIKFLGKDAPCINAKLTANGVTQYHTQVFLESEKDVSVIVINAKDEKVIKDCLNAFTKAQ